MKISAFALNHSFKTLMSDGLTAISFPEVNLTIARFAPHSILTTVPFFPLFSPLMTFARISCPPWILESAVHPENMVLLDCIVFVLILHIEPFEKSSKKNRRFMNFFNFCIFENKVLKIELKFPILYKIRVRRGIFFHLILMDVNKNSLTKGENDYEKNKQ